MTTRSLFATALVLAAACGDDGDTKPDAPMNTCATPTIGEITSYPGTFSGTVVGGGRDHSAAENSCTVQTGDAWYDPKGEDVVIRLSGLTAGTSYVINMTTTEDLSFYVTTGCPPANGTVTDCISFTDESFQDESGVFTATASEHFLIVDNAEDELPATGMFSLEVSAAECTEDTEATDCAAPTPYCVQNVCVECLSSFNCSAAAPVCDATRTCATGPSQCTGDDAGDSGTTDDGPTVATMLATPTAGVPTEVDAAVCNTPVGEGDWYQLNLAAAGDIGVTVDFSGATNDLDVYLLNGQGQVVARGESNAGIDEAIRGTNLSGLHYILVTQYEPEGTTVAVPYTLTVARPECDNDFECLVAATPVCNGAGTCVAGPTQCVSDDAADTGGTPDDGPAAARSLTGTVNSDVTLAGSICSTPRSESDWYEVAVLAGEGMIVELSWTGATSDLDPTIYNAAGETVGMSFWKNPENVTLTYLPAGTYYISVTNASATASTTVQAYSIKARRTTAQTCSTAADCADEYSTQFYRGNCASGVCQFITTTGGANGSACDSAADCTSGRCSYISFDADAEDSVCTTTCTTTSDCTAVGSGLTCISGAQTNFCVPSCTSDVECGALTNSDTIDTNLPWDYLTCTPATGVCSL